VVAHGDLKIKISGRRKPSWIWTEVDVQFNSFYLLNKRTDRPLTLTCMKYM